MSVLQTVQKTTTTTTIYIWTVHIYRLYRRQCAKYTYIYSVHIVYYKDILNYQLHIIHRYINGGLNFVDFATLNNTFKMNWLRNYLKKPSSLWNIIPEYAFSQLGGLNFLLLCNYSIEKITVALSNFHKQALLAWSMIFKHNFSPTSYFIWNNKNVCYKHKSLFLENWFKNGINRFSQLFHQNGFLFTYQEFLSHYNFRVTPKQFATVFGAIPNGVIMLFKVLKCLSQTQLTLYVIYVLNLLWKIK